jgi:hypothetical protein
MAYACVGEEKARGSDVVPPPPPPPLSMQIVEKITAIFGSTTVTR